MSSPQPLPERPEALVKMAKTTPQNISTKAVSDLVDDMINLTLKSNWVEQADAIAKLVQASLVSGEAIIAANQLKKTPELFAAGKRLDHVSVDEAMNLSPLQRVPYEMPYEPGRLYSQAQVDAMLKIALANQRKKILIGDYLETQADLLAGLRTVTVEVEAVDVTGKVAVLEVHNEGLWRDDPKLLPGLADELRAAGAVAVIISLGPVDLEAASPRVLYEAIREAGELQHPFERVRGTQTHGYCWCGRENTDVDPVHV